MSEVAVIEEVSTIPDSVAKEEKKETPEDIKKRARKPPRDGPCKRCGQDRPLNRLFLCYKCWVVTNLEKGGWREGQAHPVGCGCDLDCRLEKDGAEN